jgi:exocyst complex protein 7
MVTIRLHSNPISEAQIEKRKELEKKLEQDIQQYEMLKSSLAFTNDATKRISSMLNSFDSRLSKLEAYIMPIHSSTEVLTRTNNNLETAIGLVTEYTTVVGAINYHETVVSKGVGSTTLDLYLVSVKKLKDALHQLEASKYKSSERITQDLVYIN